MFLNLSYCCTFVADEEKPQVDEDIDVKRMRRLEQLRSRRPFGAISEDGSGWVSVSNTLNDIKSDDQKSDNSPPRKRRLRNDTPSPEPKQQVDIPADADLSPVRKNNRNRPESETKASHFPRGRSTRYDTPSPESPVEASESDRLTDLSPPRRQQRDKNASSLEPRRDLDISPPRHARSGSRYQDNSRAPSAADLSPPRRYRSDRPGSVVSDRKSSRILDDHDAATTVSDLSPPRKRRNESPMLSHDPKTGLVSGRDIKDEIDRKKKEDWLR